MIREREIARIFAAVLLIGLFCVGYVILTQPTGMIAYQTQPQEQQNKIPQEQMLKTFEQEWNEVQEELVVLGNN